MRALARLLVVVALPFVGACGGDCLSGPATYGLAVALIDDASGGPVETPAVVVARDGAYADTARTAEPWGSLGMRYVLAYVRTGSYTVSVSVAGYRPWERRGIRVHDSDACVTQTTPVTARLSR